jgi:hypothetical protein
MLLSTAFALKVQRPQETFFQTHYLMDSIPCFATGEVVMSTENEFFRMKIL